MYSHTSELQNDCGGVLLTKDLTLEWSIIAHEPSKGPFDE
jgi:hypothetical protein